MRERGYLSAAVLLPGYGTTSGPPDFWGPRFVGTALHVRSTTCWRCPISIERKWPFMVSAGARRLRPW
jgi:hypothetical protein